MKRNLVKKAYRNAKSITANTREALARAELKSYNALDSLVTGVNNGLDKYLDSTTLSNFRDEEEVLVEGEDIKRYIYDGAKLGLVSAAAIVEVLGHQFASHPEPIGAARAALFLGLGAIAIHGGTIPGAMFGYAYGSGRAAGKKLTNKIIDPLNQNSELE